MANAKETIQRWHRADPIDPDEWDFMILRKQKLFKPFKYSVYILNRVSFTYIDKFES